ALSKFPAAFFARPRRLQARGKAADHRPHDVPGRSDGLEVANHEHGETPLPARTYRTVMCRDFFRLHLACVRLHALRLGLSLSRPAMGPRLLAAGRGTLAASR